MLIVGPGAVGSVLAARFAAAGLRVLLLGRDAASERRITGSGVRVTGPDGRRRTTRGGLRSARAAGPGPVAAAFFCVKAGDTRAAIAAARPWIGPETAAVGLQNGIAHAALIRRAFGPRRSVIASCYIAADRPAPGTAAHNGGRHIQIADERGRRNAKAAELARRLLSRAGWAVRVKASEDRMLWTKLVYNASVNVLGAAGALPNGELARDPALREVLLKTIEEASAAARRAGRRPLYPDLARRILKGCRGTPSQRNSMLQDLASGRRTEARAILGPVLGAGARTPILSVLGDVIVRLEKKSLSGRP